MRPNIYPVIIAGGSGTRLWPLSRKTYPKQFSKLNGDKSLFQDCANRLLSSDLVTFKSPIIITNSTFRFIVAQQLSELSIDPGQILLEPEAKNTAPAILAACIMAHSIDENANLLISPSDHLIPNTLAFHKAISIGFDHVLEGKFVMFGIKPTRPETGFGYIGLSSKSLDKYGVSEVVSFNEKPNLINAEKMLAAGNFVWNSGIFLVSASEMIKAFKEFNNKTFELVDEAMRNASHDLGFLRPAYDPWCLIDDKSIDYAIMEKAQNLVSVPYNSQWSDLGDWVSVWSEALRDENGNVASAGAHAIDCKNSLLRSEDESLQIVGLGLENVIAIGMPDAVLVTTMDRAQELKIVTEKLKSNQVPQAEIFPKDHRPWGWFERLAITDKFHVKRIFVYPEGKLSLQSHKYRSEHWVIVEGSARVTIDDEVKVVSAGQSVFVPLGAIHRLENATTEALVLIEIQIGEYFGEDDITRYEDVYARI